MRISLGVRPIWTLNFSRSSFRAAALALLIASINITPDVESMVRRAERASQEQRPGDPADHQALNGGIPSA